MIGFVFIWLCLAIFMAFGIFGQGYIGLVAVGILVILRIIYGVRKNPRRFSKDMLEDLR